MALSFFGKKPPPPPARREEKAKAPAKPEKASSGPRTELLSTLNFSGINGLDQYADMVEVEEVGAGIGAIFEEAAVLYANGNTDEAEKALCVVLDESSNTAGEGLWMMLLDLYKLTGQRQKFESRVLDYATRFERSPPPWEDLSSQSEQRKATATPTVNLAGTLSSQAATQFQQICVIGRKSGAIQINLSRLRGMDEAGSTIFRQALAQLATDRVKVSLLNCETMIDMLSAQVQPGQAENRDVWVLLMELLQYTEDKERFEQVALDYAITFEESPPSWEGRSAVLPKEDQEQAQEEDNASSGFALEGELIGASNDTMRKLAAFADERQKVAVECLRLRRIDFVSAGMLFNILSTLQTQGKSIELQNVNAMVAALLRVMSVDQVAHVTVRV